MGRYTPAEHDEAVICSADRCTAKNAPKGSPEYDETCWRCGEPLETKPSVGDIVTVDIVDEDDRGKAVGKTESGFVLFIDEEIASIEATVEVVEIDANYGKAVRH